MRTTTVFLAVLVSIAIGTTVVAAAPTLDEAWAALPGYTYGKDRTALTTLETHVIQVVESKDEARRAELSNRLAKLLGDAATTPDARRFICAQLGMVGGPEAVPALAAGLGDEKTWDAALVALGRIPGEESSKALRGALATTTGRARMGAITALGQRRDSEAVPALAELVSPYDAATSDAAVAALAAIGGEPAAKALSLLLAASSGTPRAALVDACLRTADQLARDGERDKAGLFYAILYANRFPANVRAAALKGLAESQGVAAEAELWKALEGNNAELARAAAESIPRMPDWKIAPESTQRLMSVHTDLAVILLAGLAERGLPDARPSVLAAARSRHQAVQVAALAALGKLGNSHSVAVLADALDATAAAVHDAARGALESLAAPGVDAEILARVQAEAGKSRPALARVLGARGATETADELYRLALSEGDAKVRIAVVESLGDLLPPARSGDLVALVGKAKSEEERDTAQAALVAVARRSDDVEGRVEPLLSAYPGLAVPAQAAILGALARLGGERAFDFVLGKRTSTDAEIADAAVRALADWPDVRALDTLLEIAQKDPQKTQQVLALRGYVRLLDQLEDDQPGLLERYRAALAAASRDEERRLVLSALPRFSQPAALEMVKPLLSSPSLGDDAALAALQIVGQMKKEDQQAARPIVDQISKKAGTDTLRRTARTLLRRIP